MLVGGICNLGPPGRDRADVVRARRPAVCEQDRVDRGLDIGGAFAGEQVGKLLVGLAERVEQVVPAQAKVQGAARRSCSWNQLAIMDGAALVSLSPASRR